jgi:hypothetical protein
MPLAREERLAVPIAAHPVELLRHDHTLRIMFFVAGLPVFGEGNQLGDRGVLHRLAPASVPACGVGGAHGAAGVAAGQRGTREKLLLFRRCHVLRRAPIRSRRPRFRLALWPMLDTPGGLARPAALLRVGTVPRHAHAPTHIARGGTSCCPLLPLHTVRSIRFGFVPISIRSALCPDPHKRTLHCWLLDDRETSSSSTTTTASSNEVLSCHALFAMHC